MLCQGFTAAASWIASGVGRVPSDETRTPKQSPKKERKVGKVE
jgi:hypothetical protein